MGDAARAKRIATDFRCRELSPRKRRSQADSPWGTNHTAKLSSGNGRTSRTRKTL